MYDMGVAENWFIVLPVIALATVLLSMAYKGETDKRFKLYVRAALAVCVCVCVYVRAATVCLSIAPSVRGSRSASRARGSLAHHNRSRSGKDAQQVRLCFVVFVCRRTCSNARPRGAIAVAGTRVLAVRTLAPLRFGVARK